MRMQFSSNLRTTVGRPSIGPTSGWIRCPNRPHLRAASLRVKAAEAELGVSEIRRLLDESIRREDYARAASLKKALQECEDRSPVMRLQKELAVAVAEQRFKDAAQLQQQLQALQSDPTLPVDLATLSTSSDCVSPPGIHVRVKSYFMPSNSSPEQKQYMFAYNITIVNESTSVVQLKNRHWIITDGNGERSEVRGPGVVGVQPVLLPGKSYTYNSGCPLPTEVGTMEGEYGFVILDEADGQFKDMPDVRIGRFKLTTQAESIL